MTHKWLPAKDWSDFLASILKFSPADWCNNLGWTAMMVLPWRRYIFIRFTTVTPKKDSNGTLLIIFFIYNLLKKLGSSCSVGLKFWTSSSIPIDSRCSIVLLGKIIACNRCHISHAMATKATASIVSHSLVSRFTKFVQSQVKPVKWVFFFFWLKKMKCVILGTSHFPS